MGAGVNLHFWLEAAFWLLLGAGVYLAGVRALFPNKHVEDDR